ncbi:hypothetical protein D3C84_1021050 [compost metagenome]
MGMFDRSKLVLTMPSKPAGEIALVGSQDIHREMRCFVKHFAARGSLVDTPRDEWGAQRNGTEAVRRNANLTGSNGCGYDSYAGRKISEHIPECMRVYFEQLNELECWRVFHVISPLS